MNPSSCQHGREALPVAGVAPHRPVLDKVANQLALVGGVHAWTPAITGISLVGGIGGPEAVPLTSGVP